MSKCLKEVFAEMFHVSFLETIEPDSCHINGTMEIIVEEQHEDGSAWAREVTRHVKISHSQNQCMHYEITTDPETGIGKIKLAEVQAVQHVVVQVDDAGNQMINDDNYQVQYIVNGETMQEDHATLYYTSDPATHHQCMHIINRELARSELEIHKIIRDRNGNIINFTNDMEFLVRISNENCFEQFVKLNKQNCFHETIHDVTPGFYTIEECEYSSYAAYYSFNCGLETCETYFDVQRGHNELRIINVERSDTQCTIEKYIRNVDGTLCKPDCFEEFQVRVISNTQDQLICLHDANDFCVTLYGLEPGYYDISEVNCGSSEYETTYIVNDRDESCFASLEINECEHAEVVIINSNLECGCDIQQDSPLRICKYIRRCDGCITKPDEGSRFKVMVTGCGMKDAFYLNANNNFCVDIAHLCNGEYEIQEIGCEDYSTSYIVNDGREKTSACICVNGCENICVSIINEERNRGSLSVCKYIRNEFGDLIKPEKHQCFNVSLSSYFCKKCFVLNAENDWCMSFHDLRFSSYEIREEDCSEYTVTYLVNCEREQKHARFLVDNGCDNEVKIINNIQKNTCGVLKICKYEQTNCKEWVKPGRDEEFEIEVEGPCFCESYVLRASNNWCIMLEGLQEGEYHLHECDSCNYDVCYVINREPHDDAIVYMGQYNQEVCIINSRKQSGELKLTADIRKCGGEICRPQQNVVFEILLESCDDSFKACLNAENDWCVILEQLPLGSYRIIQTDNLGYKVSYCIHGKEESFGRITLGREDEEIVIFNEETACAGMVKVSKYISDVDGNLLMPCPQDEYHFELSGRCFCRTYTLRQRNDFCIYFDDLDEGTYEIKELDKASNVHYRINEVCCDCAKFTLSKEDVYVDIVNEQCTKGVLTIEKRIRRGDCIVLPCQEDCFQILLKGKNCHEIYDLNASNNFCICLEDLCEQHYEIKELGNNCRKVYDVNGTLQDDGYFLYEGENIKITLINEEIRYGGMEIIKKIKDEDGMLIRPNRCECFYVMVESECFKQKIQLNNESDFCVRLYDLPQGHYEVTELDCEAYVSYLVNGIPHESACVDVCEDDVCITVVNHPCAKGCLQFVGVREENGCRREPREQDEFQLLICSKQGKEEITLNCCNQFCDHLCALVPDTYTLTNRGCGYISFEIDGHVFEDSVCIELNGEHVCIDVIMHEEKGGNLTIRKCMVDSLGNVCVPHRDDCFKVTLAHEGHKECFELNKGNDWTKIFTNQKHGTYELTEVEGGSDVRYQIDDACPSPKGCFELAGKDSEVAILNTMKSSGYLHLEVMLKDCNGELIMPCDDMVFQMEVDAKHMHKTFLLNHKNGWHQKVMVDGGCYTVLQKEDSCFNELYYLVNNQKECQAVVEVDNCDQHITAINVMKCNGGSIEITKYLRNNSCGCMRRPCDDEEYEVEIRGESFHKIITLNSYNHWKEIVDCLPCGMYHVEELYTQDCVCYSIDGEKETTKAVFEVCENCTKVDIINEDANDQKGSIEICKLIKDEEGCYRYPMKEDSYWVKIKGESGTSRVLLNYANHFYASIRNLSEGWYEVIEESGMSGVQYVVNNAALSAKGLVHVLGNANTVNIINPSQSIAGSIQLSKYIQTMEGLLVKPDHGEYRIHVSKPNYNELFVLNKENNFMTSLNDLEDGVYVVDEVDHDGVTYIINGGNQVDYAVVEVSGETNQVQIINVAAPSNKGSITLAKYIRSGDQLLRPSGNDSYIFHVSKPGFNQLYTLDRQNQWMITLHDLEDGDYVINETTNAQRVTYIINGESERDRAVVAVRGNSNTVQIINHNQPTGGSIQLDKYVRDNQQNLVRPNAGFIARIHVSSPGYNEVFTLNEENQWSYTISNLANALYVVDEVDSADNVSYIVNGGSEVASAVVSVSDTANTVQIINAQRATHSKLGLTKYIKNANGTLIRPVDGDVFIIEVFNDSMTRRVELNYGNRFSAVLNDLPMGTYQVREQENDMYLTTYRVNGGAEMPEARVTMMNGSSNAVDIINELISNQSTIEVFKYMIDEVGNYLPPVAPETFQFQITGDNIDITYDLNVGNSWHQSITTLPSGRYQITETGTSPYPIKYLVNSAELQSEAIFTSLPGTTSVIGIINETSVMNNGSVMFTKRMRSRNGALVAPSSGQSFTIQVLSANFERFISLNEDNNYVYLLENLAHGTYTVEETTTLYDVSYQVNGGAVNNTGKVVITDATMNDVLIINTDNEVMYNMSGANTIKVVIE